MKYLKVILNFILLVLFSISLLLGFLTINGWGFLIVGIIGLGTQLTVYVLNNKKDKNVAV